MARLCTVETSHQFEGEQGRVNLFITQLDAAQSDAQPSHVAVIRDHLGRGTSASFHP